MLDFQSYCPVYSAPDSLVTWSEQSWKWVDFRIKHADTPGQKSGKRKKFLLLT